MNRFIKSTNTLISGETFVKKQKGVALYDGNIVTSYLGGDLQLSSHRLVWSDQEKALSLDLSFVIYIEEESGSWTKSNKIVCHLKAPPEQFSGIQMGSSFNFIKCSFRSGGASEGRRVRGGIAEIQRSLQTKTDQTTQNIAVAFEDLKQLMTMAQDMVALSKAISQRIREHSSEMTDDETIEFKSHLLSLGISDPVTRLTHGSGSSFHRELAKQIALALEKPVMEAGGMMTLTDVYCRINRARGLDSTVEMSFKQTISLTFMDPDKCGTLLSPDDLMEACQVMNTLPLPLRFHRFDSGVTVLQLSELNDQSVAEETSSLVDDKTSLTAEELAPLVNIPVILALERLLSAERAALLCRDDTVEGLRFFVNQFIREQPSVKL